MRSVYVVKKTFAGIIIDPRLYLANRASQPLKPMVGIKRLEGSDAHIDSASVDPLALLSFLSGAPRANLSSIATVPPSRCHP